MDDRMRGSLPISRMLAAWALMAMAMIANGAFREMVLERQMGEADARIVSAVIGIGLILAITGPFVRAMHGAATRELIRVGLWWLALAILFELTVGYVMGASWEQLLANYNLARGQLWPVVLASVGVAPFFWARWVGPRV
jgi:hypothetical protein